MIELKNVSKSYQGFEVLKNINLQITKGEVMGVVGQSGSGKSTLSHIIALLDNPTSGDVFF